MERTPRFPSTGEGLSPATEYCALHSSRSCLIRYAHGETIADDFKFGPADQQLIDSERHVAGVMAGSLYDRALGQHKKVADCKSDYGHIEAQRAWQPWHAVEWIFSTCGQKRSRRLGKICFRDRKCAAQWTLSRYSLHWAAEIRAG